MKGGKGEGKERKGKEGGRKEKRRERGGFAICWFWFISQTPEVSRPGPGGNQELRTWPGSLMWVAGI